ncbi:hypothetical protein TrST_g9432 [Triparma strigata]|uniref:Glycosyltransferase 61 catalytic domain-containing protein n=1 Tax=Triparma strigata TaxID=1606541 RepID=A0A9W7EFF4_9STRA|nr:hypothetical protein TrST_g9432 [Triparma strigata]
MLRVRSLIIIAILGLGIITLHFVSLPLPNDAYVVPNDAYVLPKPEAEHETGADVSEVTHPNRNTNPFYERAHSSWNVPDYEVPEDQKKLKAGVVNIDNNGLWGGRPFIWQEATYDGTWYKQYDFEGTPGELKLAFQDGLPSALDWGPQTFWMSDNNKKAAAVPNTRPLPTPYQETVGRYDEVTFEEFSKAMMQLDQPGRMGQRLATFADVWMDKNGHIVSTHVGKAVINGGCPWNRPLVNAAVTGTGLPEYDHVIGLAAMWGDAHWHFVGEMLMALAYVTPEQVEKSVIHVVSRSNYVLNWLSLFGIHEDRVVEGEIIAKHLLVAEAGRCGNPSQVQIEWFQNSLLKLVGAKMRRRIVLTKRDSRGPKHHDQIESSVKMWAKENDFEFILRTDDNLGTLYEQIEMVQKAAILIAPHGANELFDMGAHRGTCKIEMLDPGNNNLCYARSSFWSAHGYSAVSCTMGHAPFMGIRAPDVCTNAIMDRLKACSVPAGLQGSWEDTVDK